jgi:hypothetical protein
MKTPFTGGCQCGAVRYEGNAEPVVSGYCHCTRCQKLSGTAFATVLAVPTESLKIRGRVTYYESKADSGNMTRNGFCAICGSRLLGGTTQMPELTAIMAGSLDDSRELLPMMNIYAEKTQPWHTIGTGLPSFPGMPVMADSGNQ